MADFTKDPPGVMIYDHEALTSMFDGAGWDAIGLAFYYFISCPWPDDEEKSIRLDMISEKAENPVDAGIAQAAYRLLVGGAARSLKQYRQRQEDGQHYARIRWDKEQTPEEPPEA